MLSFINSPLKKKKKKTFSLKNSEIKFKTIKRLMFSIY